MAVIFGGSYGIGGEMAALLEEYGATVFAFSRSATNTHVEDPRDVEAALAKVHGETGRIDYIVVTAGVLTTGPLADTDDATVAEMIGVNYIAPVQVAGWASAISRRRRASCCCSPPAATPAAGPATACTPRARPPSST